MKYKYYYREAITDELDIEDIGNCNILAYNDLGMYYIMIIQTELGLTRIFTEGPLMEEEIFPKTVNCSFKRIDYNSGKISKEIQTFLNNPIAKITAAVEISLEEALLKCKSIIDYIQDPTKY